MRPARSAALANFAMRTNLRSGMAVGGMVGFALVAALGPLLSWTGGRGWSLEGDLLFHGYLLGALFVLRSGLEQQREGGLQTFLRHNFATPVEHALGATLALIGTWFLLTAVLFALALLYSLGDVATAAWYAWAFGLALALFLPFVLVVESISSVRIPLLLPVLAYVALAVVLALTVGQARMVEILGISVDRGDPASSLRLAGRVACVVPLGMAAFLGATWLRAGRHSGSGILSHRAMGAPHDVVHPVPRADRTP